MFAQYPDTGSHGQHWPAVAQCIPSEDWPSVGFRVKTLHVPHALAATSVMRIRQLFQSMTGGRGFGRYSDGLTVLMTHRSKKQGHPCGGQNRCDMFMALCGERGWGGLATGDLMRLRKLLSRCRWASVGGGWEVLFRHIPHWKMVARCRDRIADELLRNCPGLVFQGDDVVDPASASRDQAETTGLSLGGPQGGDSGGCGIRSCGSVGGWGRQAPTDPVATKDFALVLRHT